MSDLARKWAWPFVAALAITAAVPATASAAHGVRMAATINGKPANKTSDRHALTLAAQSTPIDLQLTNNGAAPVEARTVQLSGTVAGLTFFSYETSIRLAVPAGSSSELKFNLDLGALGGQVTGLIPAKFSVLDARRHALARQSMVVKINGSKHSVYGVFGILLTLLTALAVAELLFALARGKLPANRWVRGIRFVLPGIGIGFVLVIGASILDILAPKTGRAFPITLLAMAAMFFAGYLTPAQEDEEAFGDEDDEEEEPPAAPASPPVSAPAVSTARWPDPGPPPPPTASTTLRPGGPLGD